jgi:hypothetical protein
MIDYQMAGCRFKYAMQSLELALKKRVDPTLSPFERRLAARRYIKDARFGFKQAASYLNPENGGHLARQAAAMTQADHDWVNSISTIGD